MPSLRSIISGFRPKRYGRKQHMVLINGLAEQHESWYRNMKFWGRFFEVHRPNILAYEGTAMHRRIAEGGEISVDYLVGELHTYLDRFVQNPPYHIVSSSLGGKVAIEFAVKYPELVSRVVLICPSGMGDTEQLPVMEGVRRSDYQAVVKSVFHKVRHADRDMLRYYKRAFNSKKWKRGFIRTVRGTNDHVVRSQLKLMNMPTLFISGEMDRIVDPLEGARAASELPQGRFEEIPACGHAPQIEKSGYINRLVVQFLTTSRPLDTPKLKQLYLQKPTRGTP